MWKGQVGFVPGLAWSANGRIVVSGGDDSTVRPWEAATGKALPVLRGHTGRVQFVAIHKDNQLVLSSDSNGKVVLWDLKEGAARTNWKYHPPAIGGEGVCFSPDGRRTAWGAGDTTVRVHDLEAGREVLRLDVGTVWARVVAFSPDGKRLLVGGHEPQSAGCLALFDVATGRLLDRVELNNGVTGIAFTPDGQRAVCSHNDGRARVWRLPGR